MFWKYDEEEKKVIQREPKQEVQITTPLPDDVFLEESFPEYPNSDETGAEQRFESRVAVFQKENKPVFKHHLWWFIHNCVAHPAIGLYPCKKTFDFHDWTSKKINGK